MFIEGYSKKDVICSLLQLTSPQCTLARPRTGSVLASETPCPRFFAIATWPLVDGFLVFFLWIETCNMAFHFACAAVPISGGPVSRKVSQISTMSSNRSNSPTWKPPNHEKTSEDFPIQRYPFPPFIGSPYKPTTAHQNTPPPPASTVRSHDFPGTDGGVVLRMRRCGLGVRPGDKPEGPAAAVAVPGCTLAHPEDNLQNWVHPPPRNLAYQKMMVWKMHLVSNMASLGIYV